jgi:hypothetical protein
VPTGAEYPAVSKKVIMMLDLLYAVLACREETFLEANPHKVLAAAVGCSLLTAAFFVRQHRHTAGRKGHAFEVLLDADRPEMADEATRRGT